MAACSSPWFGPDVFLAPLMPPPLPNGFDACILFTPLLYLLVAGVGACSAAVTLLSVRQLLVNRSPIRVAFFSASIAFNIAAFALLVFMCFRPENAVAVWVTMMMGDAIWALTLFAVTFEVLINGVKKMRGDFSMRAAMGRHTWVIISTATVSNITTGLAAFAAVGVVLVDEGPTRTWWWRAFMGLMALNMASSFAFGITAIDMVAEHIDAACLANPSIVAMVTPFRKQLRYMKLVCSLMGVVDTIMFAAGAVVMPFYYFCAIMYIYTLQLLVLSSVRVYGRDFSLVTAKKSRFVRWLLASKLASCFKILFPAATFAASAEHDHNNDDDDDTSTEEQNRAADNQSLVTVDVIVFSMFDARSSSWSTSR